MDVLKQQKKAQLSKIKRYLPKEAYPFIKKWIETFPLSFLIHIVEKRNSKMGDFRPPYGRRTYAEITLNADLSEEEFLLIFIHEWAHLTVWYKYGDKIQPHGKEWKNEYATYLSQLFLAGLFAKEVEEALIRQIQQPTSSVCYDPHLFRILKKRKKHDVIFLSDIPTHSIFTLENGEIYRKGEKLRKRFKCLNLQNKKYYLISEHAEVKIINNPLF